MHRLATFILERERRIVKPLIKEKMEWKKFGWPEDRVSKAIDETLKRVGIE